MPISYSLTAKPVLAQVQHFQLGERLQRLGDGPCRAKIEISGLGSDYDKEKKRRDYIVLRNASDASVKLSENKIGCELGHR